MQSGLLGILNEILFIPSEANLGIIPRTVNIAISLNIPSEPDRMADKSGCQNTNIGEVWDSQPKWTGYWITNNSIYWNLRIDNVLNINW